MNIHLKRYGSLVLFLAVLFLCFKVALHFYRPPADSSSLTAGGINVKGLSGLGAFLRAPKTNFKPAIQQVQTIPRECVDYFDTLEKLDLSVFSESAKNFSYQMLPKAPLNCVMIDENFQFAEKKFIQACASGNRNESEPISSECASALFLMRASVTKIVLKNKKISELSDLSSLADLIFAEFSGNFDETHPPDFKRLGEVANRMLELNSHLYAAAKIASFAQIMEGINTQNRDEAFWTDARANYARAEEIKANDPSMADMKTAVETNGFDPKKTVDYGTRLVTQDPHNARAYFFIAYGQWKLGDRVASISNMKMANSLDPKNSDYQAILRAITEPNANLDSFRGAMSVGLSDQDFSG